MLGLRRVLPASAPSQRHLEVACWLRNLWPTSCANDIYRIGTKVPLCGPYALSVINLQDGPHMFTAPRHRGELRCVQLVWLGMHVHNVTLHKPTKNPKKGIFCIQNKAEVLLD